MRSVVLGFGCVLVLLTACGGRAIGGSEGEDPVGEPDPSDSEEPAPADEDGFSDYTELGECKLGQYSYEVSGNCAWVGDGRCYESRAMACNCVCPRQRESQCSSGFDAGPDGRVAVDCY
jgi:hypothetical protein